VEGEVHVQLDGVYAREPTVKLSGTVEDATGIRIVGLGGASSTSHLPPFNCLDSKVRLSSHRAAH
jgi:hypothetical protein